MTERDTGELMLGWTDATGTTWRITRHYSRTRQQWEATIASKARDTWFERQRMVLDDKGVFEGTIDGEDSNEIPSLSEFS